MQPKPPWKQSNLPYIFTVVILALAAFSCIVFVVVYRPEGDSMPLFVGIVGFLGLITGQIMTLAKAKESVAISQETNETATETQVVQKETHDLMNSRMTEMTENLEKLARAHEALARAAGVKEGIQTGIEMEVKRTGEIEQGRAEGAAANEEQRGRL